MTWITQINLTKAHWGVWGAWTEILPLVSEVKSAKLFCQIESSIDLGKRVAWYPILWPISGNPWCWLVWGYTSCLKGLNPTQYLWNVKHAEDLWYSIMHLQLELENISLIELVCGHNKVIWMYLNSGQPLVITVYGEPERQMIQVVKLVF